MAVGHNWLLSDFSTNFLGVLAYGNHDIVRLLLEKIKEDPKSGGMVLDEIINPKIAMADGFFSGIKEDSIVPLIVAVQCRHLEVVKLLLDYGAYLDIRDEVFYQTPLMIALIKQDIGIADVLIQRGADVTLTDVYKLNALYYALVYLPLEKSTGLVDKILKASSNPLDALCPYFQRLYSFILIKYYQSNHDGLKSILKEIFIWMLKYKQLLIDPKGRSNVPDGSADCIDKWVLKVIKDYKGNEDTLCNVKFPNHLDDAYILGLVVQAYVDNNHISPSDLSDLNDITVDGRPLLSHFSAYGYTTLVEKLLRYGIAADASCKSKSRTPLSYAVENGHDQVVRKLLAKGADINAVSNGKNILYYALSKSHHETLRILLTSKSSIKPSVASLPIKSYLKLFQFVWHSIKEYPDTTEDLLSVMAIHQHLMCEKEAGNQVLDMVKAAYESLARASDLAALLTDCLSKSYNKKTPLSVAVGRGNKDMVKALLDLNVPICGEEKVLVNPLSIAIEKGDQEIFQLLLAKATSADINQLDYRGKNSICYATSMVKALVASGAFWISFFPVCPVAPSSTIFRGECVEFFVVFPTLLLPMLRLVLQ
ncbi:MAG: ankyrin repeat domain-containing protein [Amoebophilaceae bacterium]|nr:ankyrin repeat domain-containing protein [Amoebophilaceae bacterium]